MNHDFQIPYKTGGNDPFHRYPMCDLRFHRTAAEEKPTPGSVNYRKLSERGVLVRRQLTGHFVVSAKSGLASRSSGVLKLGRFFLHELIFRRGIEVPYQGHNRRKQRGFCGGKSVENGFEFERKCVVRVFEFVWQHCFSFFREKRTSSIRGNAPNSPVVRFSTTAKTDADGDRCPSTGDPRAEEGFSLKGAMAQRRRCTL